MTILLFPMIISCCVKIFLAEKADPESSSSPSRKVSKWRMLLQKDYKDAGKAVKIVCGHILM